MSQPINVFAIGDIHGEEGKLNKLLQHWNPDSHKLVFLGDLIDRGENSYNVIRTVMWLKETYGAEVIGGNHESLFLDWLKMPRYSADLYYPQGGRETIHSFFEYQKVTFKYQPHYIRDLLKEQFTNEIEFLENLPNYYEWGDYVFVHAGVNLDLKDWKNTSENDFRWIRDSFIKRKNETGMIFVFGHTPTSLLHPTRRCTDIWVSSCKTKIGIDGGAVYGGQLHGVSINSDGEYTVYSVD